MPELPEVDLMVQRLKEWRGCKITDVVVDATMSSKAASKFLPGDEATKITGQRILEVCRRGKFMIFITEDGALLAHNAMSGYWDLADEPWTFDYVEGARVPGTKDVRVRLLIEPAGSGEIKTIRFHDARMFGSLRFLSPEQLAEKLDKLGPEAILTPNAYEQTPVISIATMFDACKSKRTIKEVLMDQDKIAGLGNIYAVETLFNAQIKPTRIASSLSTTDVIKVLFSIKTVLQTAITNKLDYAGLCVYRRAICKHCENKITVEDIKGRSTYWCDICQK